jgi:CrcB protein
MTRRDRLLVLVGAMVGTGLRYAAFRIWYHRPGTFPTTTLVVNSVGAFALGALVGAIAGHRHETTWHWFARVGVLGGFTTFSAYAIELALYVRDGDPVTGVIYAIAMTLVAIVAALAGQAVARDRLTRRAAS